MTQHDTTNAPPDLLLDVHGLGKTFHSPHGPVHAVRDVGFSIARGETVGLVGESGSGKTTIGRMISRLIDPTAGQMWYHGTEKPLDLAALSARRYRPLRADIQVIFQDPYASLNPRLRVAGILGEALDAHGLAKGAARLPRIHALLRQVGLNEEQAQRFPHEFSGGQRQRIGIARALAVAPRMIVADEPLSALDVSIQAQVINLLGDIKDSLGLTMLIISHDLDVIEYLCDRVIVLYLGRIVEVAPTSILYKHAGHPYTQALLAASPQPDPKAPPPARLIEGDPPSPADPPSGCVFRTRCPLAEARCAGVGMSLRPQGPGHWHACWKNDNGAGNVADTPTANRPGTAATATAQAIPILKEYA